MKEKDKILKKKNENNSNERIFDDMLMKRAGSEKIKMGFSMFQFASKFVISSINSKFKNRFSDSLIREALFLRIYGNDFNDEEIKNIIKMIVS